MHEVNRLSPEAMRPTRVPCGAVRGTIQHVDYRKRKLLLIAYGRVWEFRVEDDCRLWFNNVPAILRCFHALDPVTVLYQTQPPGNLARVLLSWEPEAATERE
jgi:hypothetical protein